MADVIGRIHEDTVYLLPPALMAFENALSQSTRYCRTERKTPLWFAKSYFKVLDVLVSKLAQKSKCDLEQFLRKWFETPAAAPDTLDDRLIVMLRRRSRLPHTSRETVVRGLGYVFDYYTEKKFDSLRSKLSSKAVLALREIIADNKETPQMKRTAQQALSIFSPYAL